MEDSSYMEMPDMSLDSEREVVGAEEGGASAAVDLRALDDEGAVEEAAPEPSVPCEFVTGCAGTGKTFNCRERIAADPSWGLLTSTTGISAVNLGTITLNSCLRFFDTASLRDAYLNGSLIRRLREIREHYRRLVVDEISMMDGEQLGILVRAALEANSYLSKQPPIGLYLTGDFCQLPPVKAKWVFESDEWHRFEAATTRLTKVWRQGLGPFLDALNFARAGNGAEASEILSHEGLEWHSALDTHFDGTTIVSKNDQVSRYNGMALDLLPGALLTVESRRWGKQRSEWGQNRRTGEWGIPPRLGFKLGALVMLLANSYDEERNLVYANGDTGHIRSYEHGVIGVELVRNGELVEVGRIRRDVSATEKPSGTTDVGHGEWMARPHWQPNNKRYVEGQVEYYPMRLAYASSVHKSQGLSLDRIQVDIRDQFFGQPAMAYTALSRCRTLQGLRIVGQRERFVKNCNIDERVRPWL
jgi:ATP-dependent DNA helicase PIF1